MFKVIIFTSALAICNVAYASPTFDQLHKLHLGGSAESRIVGGVETTIEHAPHQVSLQFSEGHMCGGSLIDNKWVLTAAHCTAGLSAAQFRVRAGSSKHAEGGIMVDVKRIVEHEKYDSLTIDYDFSLLELAEELKFNVVMQKVELPKQDEPVQVGTLCEVTGWGATQNLEESNEILRKVSVPIVDQRECINAYTAIASVTDSMICAGYKAGGKNGCQGDSGGPLLSNGTLVGVVSWAYGCGKPGYPSVYSRVGAVRHWIQKTTGV